MPEDGVVVKEAPAELLGFLNGEEDVVNEGRVLLLIVDVEPEFIHDEHERFQALHIAWQDDDCPQRLFFKFVLWQLFHCDFIHTETVKGGIIGIRHSLSNP